jgi:hypothetical protein
VVDSIVGRTGAGVHSLELWQRDGKVHRHGSDLAMISSLEWLKLETHLISLI